MDELFGGLFDFDFDGETDHFEMALGFGMMSDATMNFFGEEESRDSHDDDDIDRDDPFYDPIVDGDFYC